MLPNKEAYDAQVANLVLKKVRSISGKYSVLFRRKSHARHSIFSFGPHSPGTIISFSVWIRTRQSSEMIIVHYGDVWNSSRSIFSLTIDEGRPKLYARENTFLTTINGVAVNDGKWHHIAVSMP